MSRKTPLVSSAALVLLLPAAPAEPSGGAPVASPAATGRIPVLILTGENRTDWRWTSTCMRQVLEDTGKFDVEVTMYPDGSLADAYDRSRFEVFLIDYAGARWGEPAESRFLETIAGGKGVVLVGASVSAFPDWEAYRELSGFSAAGRAEPAAFGPVELSPVDLAHPLIEGMADWPTHSDRIQVGLTRTEGTDYQWIGSATPAGAEPGTEPTPALLVGSYGEGRVVSTPLGWVDWNDRATWASQMDPVFQQLLVRSVEWAARGELTPLSRVLPNTLTEADRADGWKLLFDGDSTSGWESFEGGFPAELWSVEGGELHVTSGDSGQDLFLDQSLEQFELELEWKVAKGHHGEERDAGGLAFHEPDGSESRWRTGFASTEAEQLAAGERLLRPAGEFNLTRIVARSDRVEHWLNGSRVTTLFVSPGEWARRVQGENLVNDPEMSHSPIGRLALERGGTDVWFRNIRIRPILPPATPEGAENAPAEPPPLDLLADGMDGWRWVPQVNNTASPAFEIEGELLVDKGWPTGYLATQRKFGSYALEFDWRYDPKTRQAGEAGLYLVLGADRTLLPSGGGLFWPDGLQLDLSVNQVGSLVRIGRIEMTVDRRRSDGQRTRPMRNLERRIGEWNHVEIRYADGDLLVKLNGEVVNAASGLELPAASIGLKATGTALHFRGLMLRGM